MPHLSAWRGLVSPGTQTLGTLSTPRSHLRDLSLPLHLPCLPRAVSLGHHVQVNDTPRSSTAGPYPASISPPRQPALLPPPAQKMLPPQNDLDYLRKGRHRRSSETLEALRKDAHIYEGSLCLSCTPLHRAVKGDSQSQETLIA